MTGPISRRNKVREAFRQLFRSGLVCGVLNVTKFLGSVVCFHLEGPPEWLVWFNYLTSYLSLLIWLVTTVLGFYCYWQTAEVLQSLEAVALDPIVLTQQDTISSVDQLGSGVGCSQEMCTELSPECCEEEETPAGAK